MVEQAPGKICGPLERGPHTRAGFLAGLVTLWGTHAGAVCEDMSWEGLTLDLFMEHCLPWEGSAPEQRKSVWSPSHEEESQNHRITE